MGGCQVPYVRRPQALSCRFLGIALLPVVAALVHHPGEKREPPCLSFVGALEAQRTSARCLWSEGAPIPASLEGVGAGFRGVCCRWGAGARMRPAGWM